MKDSGRTIVIDTPEGIAAFRCLALLGRLRLEAKGLKFRIPTAPRVRKEFGIKKRRIKDIVVEFEKILREKGILIDGHSSGVIQPVVLDI